MSSFLWRVAFHNSGKPRGWLRTVAISSSKRAVRPLFKRVFHKKNGDLRPKLASYLRKMPHYLQDVFPNTNYVHETLSIAENIGIQIFAEQQAEMTPDLAKEILKKLSYRPLISVIMPIYNTPIEWLLRAIESLQGQFYPNWELCVVDDGSPDSRPHELVQKISQSDTRIRLSLMPQNGGISAASNLSLKMAEGDFIALLDHDDEITPDALLRIVMEVEKNPNVDFLYSDECKIDASPARLLFDFMFKPAWSPEIMFNGMLTGHLTVYRTELVRKIGGFRSEFDYSQDYDLALRMAEATTQIAHVERILYLWRAIPESAASGGKSFARAANIAALSDAIARKGVDATVEAKSHANVVQLKIPKFGSRVSIIIPSDSPANLRLAIDALKFRTSYENFEVLAVCNSNVASILRSEYSNWPNLKLVLYDKPFNFSDKCNVGANSATGDIVVFYNDDVFPIKNDWLDRLIEYLFIPGVGATSPQLLYKNGTIQYAGMISGMPTMAATAYHGRIFDATDKFLSMNRYVRNVSILSGACLAIRRELFSELGGFDSANTPDGHSDIDLSYKVMQAGWRCVYTPYSLLTHIGNHSWDQKAKKYKADIFLLKRWGKYASDDAFFSHSMRRVLDKDFSFEFRIYANSVDPKASYDGPNILFVSHELSNTGAPRMVLEAAQAIKSAGGFPVVVSPKDGPLRGEFEKAQIAVIIDPSAEWGAPLFQRFARNFDLVIVNTDTLYNVVESLSKIPLLRILWWIHEGATIQRTISKVASSVLKRVSMVTVSHYSNGFIRRNLDAKVLHNGVADRSQLVPKIDRMKMTFLVLGTIEHRKGQDLFVRAASQLPASVKSECDFIIAGKSPGDFDPYMVDIQKYIHENAEIKYLGSATHEAALKLIATADVLVCCSRDDAFSLVAIEAASLGRPIIFSDHVGAREVLNEECSLVFPSEDVTALRDRMLWAYQNQMRMKEMGLNARKVYEEELTDGHFAKRFNKIVMEEIKRHFE